MGLSKRKLHELRYTFYDVCGIELTDEQLTEKFNSLPEELKSEGKKYGFDDTDFVIHLREHVLNKRLNILRVNTRRMFNAIVHGQVSIGNLNSPSLIILRCSDGKIFLESEKEGEFNNVIGVSYPFVEEKEYKKPFFFMKKSDAENRAVELLSPMIDKLS